MVKRVVRILGKTLLGLVAFVAVVLAIAVAGLQTPWAKRQIGALVGDQLNTTFKGHFELVFADASIGLSGVRGVDVRILDLPNGKELIRLDDVDVAWSLTSLLASLLDGPIRIEVPIVTSEAGFVDLATPEDLASAFEAREASETTEAAAEPSVLVDLSNVQLREVTLLVPGQGEEPTTVLVPALETEVWVGEHVVVLAHVEQARTSLPQGPAEADIDAVLVIGNQGSMTAAVAVGVNVGQARATAVASLFDEDFRVQSAVDAPASAIAEMDLGWAPVQDVALDLEAVSQEGDIEAKVRVMGGSGEIDVLAAVNPDPLDVHGVIMARRVNPADYSSDVEAGVVDFDGTFHLNDARGELALEVPPARYAGEALPPVSLRVTQEGWERFSLDAETGNPWPATVAASLRLGDDPFVTARVRSGSHVALPIQSRRVAQVSAVELDATARFDAKFTLREASLRANIDQFSLPGEQLSVRGVRGDVNVTNTEAGLAGSGRIDVKALQLAGQRAQDITVRIEQKPRGLSTSLVVRVQRAEEWIPVTAAAVIADVQNLELTDVRVSVRDEPIPVRVAVRRVALTPEGDIAVQGATLSGAGQIQIDGSFGRRHHATVSLAKVDVERLARLAVRRPPVAGLVSGDVELDYNPNTSAVDGKIRLTAEKLRVENITIPLVNVDVSADTTQLSGSVYAELRGSTGALEFEALDIRALEVMAAKGENARLADFFGNVAVHVRATEAGLKELLPEADVPRGLAVDAELQLSHAVGEPLTITNDVSTTMMFSESPVEPSGAPIQATPTSSATLTVKSEYVETRSDWQHTVELQADNGGSAELSLGVALPLATTTFGELAQHVQEAQFQGELSLAYSDLSLLPRDLPLPGLKGQVDGNVTFKGKLARPSVTGSVYVRQFQVQSVEKSLPVDIEINGRLADGKLVSDVEVHHERIHVASARANVDVTAGTAAINARLENFSVGCFPFVRDYGVEGHITGFANVDATEGRKVSAYVLGRGFKVYGEEMPFWSVAGTLQGGTATGRVQVAQIDGTLDTELEVRADEAWENIESIRLATVLENFEIRPVLAVARGPISNLSGKLDGSMEVTLEDQNLDADGELRLTAGRVLVPVLGRDIKDIELTMLAKPGEIDIEGLKANFGRGRFAGGGGLSYTPDGDLELTVNLDIPERDAIPILSEGREIAEVSGSLTLRGANTRNEGWNSAIELSGLRININEDLGINVGAIEPPDYVRVGHRREDGRFRPYEKKAVIVPTVGAEPEPMRFTVDLGKEVWVYRGRSTFAALEGKLQLELGNEVKIEGGLQIPEGRIDVMGRVFEVQPSTVTFTGGTPPDPEVVAEASWLSPSGHTITASYRGPATSGRMQLKSEPALSYGEILNVLLFDDPTGAGDSQGSTSASSVAGTLAGAGLGRTLSDLTDLNIQTSVQTTESGASRPEVGVRLSPRFAFQVSYNPQPVISLSEPPDQTTVSLDWRISKRWSLDTSLGDQGSASADLAWEFRY